VRSDTHRNPSLLVRPCLNEIKDKEEDEAHEQKDEEGRVARAQRDCRQPTEQEVKDHMMTHVPFRDWCPHCVK